MLWVSLLFEIRRGTSDLFEESRVEWVLPDAFEDIRKVMKKRKELATKIPILFLPRSTQYLRKFEANIFFIAESVGNFLGFLFQLLRKSKVI